MWSGLMLKLSNRGIYGIKALYELARNYGGSPTSIRLVSERHGLPVPFLEQVLHDLKRYGLVASKRGVNGGYILAKPPENITVGDAVRALEGPFALCECLQSLASGTKDSRIDRCVTSGILNKLGGKVEEVFDSVTFAELAKEHIDTKEPGICNERYL